MHYLKIIIICLTIIYTSEENNITMNLNNTNDNRIARFWSSGLVRIENSVCLGVDGLLGTCYTRWQCKSINGILSGRCHGVGTCCVVQETCGSVTSYNNTYFVNPGYPGTFTGPGSCTITIQRCNPDICQIRLDFLMLTLAQPDPQGYCLIDSLHIRGGANPFTPICGENSGQHVYMGFNGDTDIRLTIITGDSSLARSWQIKIAQIGCGCPTTAPTGCLMYYTDLTGTVTSFNYGTSVGDGTRQIANTNYGICVAMQPGYCSIRWSKSDNTVASFSVSGDINAVLPPLPAPCTTDYVIIPNPNPISVQGDDRFCGTMFVPVETFSKPFVLTTVTDGNEDNDVGNSGFSLNFEQIPCAMI